MKQQLFPRQPRRMRQPKKDALRDELARAATTIERQAAEIDRLAAVINQPRTPWWRRLLNRRTTWLVRQR